MVIREMSREECIRRLAGARLARLACAHENQPYVVPVYLTYAKASGFLYGVTTPGQKVEWMRANPLVCVEFDEVATSDQWVSVIVFGRYEELPGQELSDPQGQNNERLVAHQVLQEYAMWWEPASAAHSARVAAAPFMPVFYRVRIDRITGYEATRQAGDESAFVVAVPSRKVGWLRRVMRRVCGVTV